MKKHRLKFYYLKYEVVDIRKMIKHCTDINNFVFSFYSADPDSYIQLIAFARTGTDCNDNTYSKYTDILQPYRKLALEIDGPVIMSNNYIPIAVMQSLIGDPDNQPDYLIFTPGLNDDNHIYYTVHPYKKSLGDTSPGNPDDYTITNPSPPATMGS
ncbi:hypothetical protein [Mucilaginibacter agri]|uniref:Uncharacterized protein n=1 Tax=Mucilaginibacter agri TaxID=2695265 RepID=A0A965ZLQ1_9SPHI|nr:hypothetical protein [Mucilaginibacter agri]NCD72298.1 hypothetical protein [Mucilaginibacter agri]